MFFEWVSVVANYTSFSSFNIVFQRSFFTLHKWCLRLHLWKWISYLFSVISYIKLGKSDCDVFLLLGRPFAFKKIKGIQGLMKYNLLKLGRIHWVSMAKGNLNKTKQTMTTRSMVLKRMDAEWNKLQKDHIMISFHFESVLYRTILRVLQHESS